MSTSDKLTYLSTTKSNLKDMINYGLDNDNKITNETTFRNYSNSLFNSYLETLKNPDILFGNLPKVSGSGTNIILNNTKETRMKIQLKGDTYQASEPTPTNPVDVQVVKNRQNIQIVKSLYPLSLYVNDTAIKKNSCTVTLDGNEFVFSATGTDIYFGNVSGSGSTYQEEYGPLFEIPSNATQITIKTDSAFNHNFIQFYDSTKTWVNRYNTNTKEIPSGAKYASVRIGKNNAVSGTTYRTKIIVYFDSQEQNYQVDLTAENLFDGQIEVGSINPANGSLAVNDNRRRSKNFTKVSPNTTYTLTREETGGFRWIVGYTSSKVGVTDGNVSGQASAVGTTSANTDLTITFTTSPTTEYIKWYDTASTSLGERVMINIGNVSMPYQNYGTSPIELCKIGDYQDRIFKTTGKNLFDKNNVINAYLNTDGTTTSNSTFRVSDYIAVGSFSYITIQGNEGSSELCCFYDTDKNHITGANIGMGASTTKTISIPNNAEYIRVTVKATVLDQYQLEIGSQATSYEPYSYNEWYVEKKIGKVVLKGSENWNYRSDYNAFYLNDTTSKGINAPLSNYFKGITSGITTNDNSVLFNTTTLYLIYHTLNGVITDLRTWLSTHNTNVYYVLSTPTYIKITDNKLINDLNNLAYGSSYNGQTNVNSSGNMASLLNVNAIQG